jgi:hypothetical protein
MIKNHNWGVDIIASFDYNIYFMGVENVRI